MRCHWRINGSETLMFGNIVRSLGLILLFGASPLSGWAQEPEAKQLAAEKPAAATAVVIPLHGEITPLTGAFLDRKLEEAREMGVDVVIIDIDSPGGFADVSFDIARRLRDLKWAKTVAYVEDQAISGAAIAALGCDEIIMRPGAMLGDAGVIAQEILGGPFKYAPEKILSKMVADIREVADAGGRPPALAEAMMHKDVQVFQATHKQDGRVWYYTKAEWDSLPDAEDWEQGKPVMEARENTFLTVTGKRAVELQIANGLADSKTELYEQLGIAKEPKVLAQTGIDTLVWVLNLPLITFLLFVIGLLAIFIEFSAPGLGMGGLVSTLCFGLFFWSRFLGGTSGWLEVTLFAVGLIFIACEIFVIPGFGVPGISGFLLVLGSLVMASRNVVWPESTRDLMQLNKTLATVGASMIAFVVLAMVGSRYLLDFPLFRRIALLPPEVDDQAAAVAVGTAYSASNRPAAWEQVDVGDAGIATSPLRPAGKAAFGDELVDVITEGEFVEAGKGVKIVQKHGTRVVVRSTT
ncbi:NfeD family protein [Rosistilla oblonga]|uniref:NfeD family protein n=1 Tax=Rosistilla oblonga TaxID=2527990 RepID=UPI003A96C17D